MELSFEPFAQVASVSDQTQARLYYRRFVETQFAVYGYGHMVFAAYAAVPALLTPDLLYKLWQNFSNYEWQAKSRHIHRIAVSDVLLHLCEDLGQELYEMPAGLKLALLDWLNKESQDENDLNLSSPQQIAQFVIAYHENPSSGFQRHGLGYEDLQLWTAQHVLDPEYAYNKVYEALRSKLDSPDEFLRLLELWDQLRLNGQALGYALTPDQENLAALKPSWKALIQEDSMALQQELQHLAGRSDLRQYLQPAKGTQLLGLSIPARLQSVVQEMVSSIVQESVVLETEVADGPSIHGILIGVGRAEGREDWPVWDDVWAVQEYFAELCQSQGVNWKPHILLDSREQIPEKELSWVSIERPLYEASTENVDQVVQQILTLPSHPQDVLLIYYQGVHHSRYLQLKGQTLDLNDYLHLTNRLPSFLFFEGFELANDLNLHPEVLQKPFVQFRATHATQQGLNQVIGGKKRAPFTHFFLEVLREGGFQRSYSEVFYRSEFLAHNLLPQLRCTSTYYNLDYKAAFLNGTLADTGFQYLLEYGGEGSWSLNAGKNRGITPSSDFMQTIVRAEDGREFIIGDVYENRALIKQKVEWLGQSRPGAIPVTLLQTAIPRMKIAFEPGMDVEARRAFENAISMHKIYYVEFVEHVDDARFFIRFLEGRRYALFNQLSSRRSPRNEEYPLFLPMEAPYLFIVQIEHIAKWYGVLEYDNIRGTLSKGSIDWEVETYMGSARKGALQHNPLQIVLHYEKEEKPRFSCKVTNRSAQALFVSCLYLGADFEISDVPLQSVRIESEQGVWLFEKQSGTRAPKKGIPDVISEFKKVENVTEFIKFFVSEQYFTPEAFVQSAIRTGVFRDVDFERSNVFRGFEGGDWTSVVVPVEIRKGAESRSPILLWYDDQKGWVLNKGFSQNISNNSIISIQEGSIKFIGKPSLIQPAQSIIQFDKASQPKLDRSRTYQCKISLPLNLRIQAITETMDKLEELKEKLQEQIVEINFTDLPDEEPYTLFLLQGEYRLAQSEVHRPIIQPIPLSKQDAIKELGRYLSQISQWEYVKSLQSKAINQGAFPIGLPLDVQVKWRKDDGTYQEWPKKQEDLVELPLREITPDQWSANIQIWVKNRYNFPLWVAVLYLDTDYSVTTLLDQKVQVIGSQSSWLLLESPIGLKPHFYDYNWANDFSNVKFIVSTKANIEIEYMLMDQGLPLPVCLDTDRPRSGIASGFYDVKNYVSLEEGWSIQDLVLQIPNPLYNSISRSKLEAMLNHPILKEYAEEIYVTDEGILKEGILCYDNDGLTAETINNTIKQIELLIENKDYIGVTMLFKAPLWDKFYPGLKKLLDTMENDLSYYQAKEANLTINPIANDGFHENMQRVFKQIVDIFKR